MVLSFKPLTKNRQLSFKELYILGQYLWRPEKLCKQDVKRSYEGFAFYLRCACILALYVRHILSLQVYMARLGMKFFKVITPFGKWNLVDRVRRRGSIFVSVFYQIKLSIGPFSMVYFCLGKVLDDMSASLGVLNQFCWTYSLHVLQDRWIFRSKYKCAWRSNRRCSQLDTQGHPADEWNFNVFA